MKRIKQLLTIAVLAVSLIACAAAHAAPEAESQDALRRIIVVGMGKVSLVPDVARINVGAEARACTVSRHFHPITQAPNL